MGGNEMISYGSLLLFSVLSYLKCGPTASKLNLSLNGFTCLLAL